MPVSIKNLQPTPTAKLSSWLEIRYKDGTSSYVSLANFGAGAAGAGIDTAATAHGGIAEIAEVTAHS